MAVRSETLLSLRTRVRSEIIESQPKSVSNDDIDAWINDGMIRCINAVGTLEVEDTISVVSDQASYNLPSDHKDTIDLEYTAPSIKRNLILMSPRVYRSFQFVTTTSIPTHYSLIGEKVFIYRTPSNSVDTISHRYIAHPQKLESDSDVPFNDIERFYPYHDLPLLYATFRAKTKTGDKSGAGDYKAMFDEGVFTMKKEMASNTKAGSYRMQPTHGGVNVMGRPVILEHI